MSDIIPAMNTIDEVKRSFLKALHPVNNWDDCGFCHEAPATHETSSGDFVCHDCCYQFEGYMQAIWGKCDACGRALIEDGSCKNCEYEVAKSQDYDGYEPHQALYYLFRMLRKGNIYLSAEDDMDESRHEEWSAVCDWIESNSQEAYKALRHAMEPVNGSNEGSEDA